MSAMENLSLSTLAITPQYEFAEDERISFLRKHADEAQFEGVPLTEVPMIKLIPSEIRESIYVHLLDDQHIRVDITTSRGTTFRLREGMPTLFRGALKTLMKVGDQDIYDEVKRFLHKCVTYFNENGDTFERLPRILGTDIILIHRLEVRMNYKIKCKHRNFWPRFLVALQALSNLEYLRLYSTSEPGKPYYNEQESGDPDGTVTKHQQEVRALRLLGSFAVLRHPNLDIMVQPARCQPNFRDDEGRFVHEYELYKYDANRPIKFYDGDQVINTTSSRRVKWTEGCLADPTSFWIKLQTEQSIRDMKTSEVTSMDELHFRSIDSQAYQTNELLKARGLSWKPFDALVDRARKYKLEAERRATHTMAPTGPEVLVNSRRGGFGRRGNAARGRGPIGSPVNRGRTNYTARGRNTGPRDGNSNGPFGGDYRGNDRDMLGPWRVHDNGFGGRSSGA